MTLRELSSEICALGFDSYTKPDVPLIFAVKRALTAIYGELRITSKTKLHVTARTPSSKVARLHHTGGGVETLPLSGKAYAMTASGSGCITVFDGANSSNIKFNSDAKLIKGFLKYGGKAVFSGDSSFDVYNIVTYDEAFGDDIASIPEGDAPIRINVRERVRDFLGFTSPALDADGKPIASAVLDDGTVTVPASYEGEINVKYRRLPDFPSLAELDAQIDIPREYEILLPLLTAFYVLLDEDKEKAEIYKSSYLEMLNCIKRGAYSLSNTGYADVNGWGR